MDRAESRLAADQQAVIQSARAEVAKASQSIAAAPQDNLPVQLTTRFIDNSLPLLDQVAGPMTAQEAADLRALVRDLLDGKADAESRQRAAEATAEQRSRQLAATEQLLAEARANLRSAFERETRLANRYRKALWTSIGLGALSLVATAGMWYVKSFYGGGVAGIAGALSDLRAGRHPAYQDFVTALDVNLSPTLQRAVNRLKTEPILPL